MSYTRSFSEVVSGSRTVNVSYPASEHGGSTSVSVDVSIPVNIAIAVDTRPFDQSVAHCERGMYALTGAVAATGTAQAVAVTANANKVADTVLSGFFKLIRSELSQQVSEYGSRCEALALKLADLKAACHSKTSQMQKDFDRIAARYADLFQGLDQEHARRVRTIDGIAFTLRDQANAHITSHGASVICTLTAREEGEARTGLGASALKQSAVSLLRRAGEFLVAERALSQGARSILTNQGGTAVSDRHVPVLWAEVDGDDGTKQQALVSDTGSLKCLGSTRVQDELRQACKDSRANWIPMDDNTHSRIETFIKKQAAGSGVDARVGMMVMQLWQQGRPSALAPALRREVRQ